MDKVLNLKTKSVQIRFISLRHQKGHLVLGVLFACEKDKFSLVQFVPNSPNDAIET